MGGGFHTFWASSVVYVALLPLLVAAHELGHAGVVLARSQARVTVNLGRTPAKWRFSLGRIDFALHPDFWLHRGPPGSARPHDRLDVWSTVALGLAGPLADAFAAGIVVLVGVTTNTAVVGDAGLVGVALAFGSLLPFRVRGRDTDGANILRVLRYSRKARRTS